MAARSVSACSWITSLRLPPLEWRRAAAAAVASLQAAILSPGGATAHHLPLEARMTRADIEALISRRDEGWTRHDPRCSPPILPRTPWRRARCRDVSSVSAASRRFMKAWVSAFTDIAFVSDDVLVDGTGGPVLHDDGNANSDLRRRPSTGRRFPNEGRARCHVRRWHRSRRAAYLRRHQPAGAAWALRTKPVTQ